MVKIFRHLLVFSLGGLLACVNPFSPKLADSTAQDQFITEQQSPEEVLQNFRYAYNFRDSLLYADLLDSAFSFRFFNPDLGESGALDGWERENELRITSRMFRSFDSIELIWLNTIFQNKISESEEIHYKNFRLTLVGSAMNITLSGYAIFTFQRNADGKWRIKRWQDESSL